MVLLCTRAKKTKSHHTSCKNIHGKDQFRYTHTLTVHAHCHYKCACTRVHNTRAARDDAIRNSEHSHSHAVHALTHKCTLLNFDTYTRTSSLNAHTPHTSQHKQSIDTQVGKRRLFFHRDLVARKDSQRAQKSAPACSLVVPQPKTLENHAPRLLRRAHVTRRQTSPLTYSF